METKSKSQILNLFRSVAPFNSMKDRDITTPAENPGKKA